MSKKAKSEVTGGVTDAAPDSPAAGPPREEAAGADGPGEGKRPPAHVVRIGRLKACVWINQAKDGGKCHYGVTVARTYRTFDGGWGQASSFDRGDLLPLAEALRLAFLWIAANSLAHGEDDVPF